jgi:hypothetical protein
MGDIRIQDGYYFALNKANGMTIVVQWDEKAGAFWLCGDDTLMFQQAFFYEYLFCPERLPEPENRRFREFWRGTV